MAPVLVAELTGDLSLLPVLAVTGAAAHGLDRLLDHGARRVELARLDRVRDEDA